jgi:hypothetical protein
MLSRRQSKRSHVDNERFGSPPVSGTGYPSWLDISSLGNRRELD